MLADIAQGHNIRAVRDKVNELARDGWKPEGAPFFDASRNEWCWAVLLDSQPVAPGGIKLREVQRKAQ